MIALKKLSAFAPGTNLRAWFAQIVTNVARNAARDSRSHSARVIPFDPAVPAKPPDASHPVGLDGLLNGDTGAFDDRLVDALSELGDDARAALLLRAVHDLSYSEIATTLGIPEGTAMSHVHRSRERLRQELGTNGARRAMKP